VIKPSVDLHREEHGVTADGPAIRLPLAAATEDERDAKGQSWEAWDWPIVGSEVLDKERLLAERFTPPRPSP